MTWKKQEFQNFKLWSGHGTLDEEDLRAILTLDNIYKYASEEELSAIVHSIFGRLCNYEKETTGKISSNGFTDKEFDEVVKGLRKPQ